MYAKYSNQYGALPQPPGFIAFILQKEKSNTLGITSFLLFFFIESCKALGLHPCIALSSIQARAKVYRQVRKEHWQQLFHQLHQVIL